MGVSMKKDKQKSLKTITLDKNRLKQEMKLHTGSGVNGSCTYDDVAEILGYANGKTIINKKYTFPVNSVCNLCDKWKVRLNYLTGFDEFRNDDDFYKLCFEKGKGSIDFYCNFIEMLGFKNPKNDCFFVYSIPKNEYKKSFSKYGSLLPNNLKYLLRTSDNVIDIIVTSEKDLALVKYGFLYVCYFVIKNKNDEPLGIISYYEIEKIINILKDNAFNLFNAFIDVRNNHIVSDLHDKTEIQKYYDSLKHLE